MASLIFAVRSGDGIYDVASRVKLLRDSFDSTTLAGSIPALKDNNYGALLEIHLVAQFAELNLSTRNFADV